MEDLQLVARLVELYRSRPETARARAEVEEASRAIIDGRDLIDVAERALLRPLDLKAQAEIAKARAEAAVQSAEDDAAHLKACATKID